MTDTTSPLSAGLVTALITLLLAACGSDEPVASDQSANQTVAGTSSEEAEAVPKKAIGTEIGARHGDSPGKPVAPIDIDYEMIGEARPNEPFEIELKLRTGLDGPATVQLQPRAGLEMGASQAAELRWETMARVGEPPASAGAPVTERVVVVPPAEGRFYLSVLVSVATPEGEQLRAVSIPVQVGDQPPAMRDNGELTTTEGETVRSLPAKESDGS